MIVATGTTIGLHATPGDGKSQTPQVTLAYKRDEIALVPTGSKPAKKNPDSDCYSALAVVDFRTKWFGSTSVDQFIATGHASRDIQNNGPEFTAALAQAAAARIQTENQMIKRIITAVDDGSGKVDPAKVDKLAKGTPIQAAVAGFHGKPVSDFEAFLKTDGRPFTEALQKNIQ